MKFSYVLKQIIFIIAASIVITSCTPDGDKKLKEGYELYNNKKYIEAKKYVEEGLIDSSQLKKFSETNFTIGDNIIYYRHGNYLRTIWPAELSIESGENYVSAAYDPSKKFGISNGQDIKVYNADGTLIKTCGPTPDDKPIKAFIIIGEKIYYYKDQKISVYNISSDSESLLTNEKFISPFEDGNFNVKLFNSDNTLLIIPGIAGKYRLYIYNLNNNTNLLYNQILSSSKLLLKNDGIYCVKGDSGKYSMIKISIPSMKMNIIYEFNNLKDMDFSPSGIMFEKKEGLYFFEYENRSEQKIPFAYELAGQCGGNPVIKYANAYYIIDISRFMEKLSAVKVNAPSLFE